MKKEKLRITNGYLKYKNTIKYLGIYLTDKGNLKCDTELYISKTRSNIYSKFTSFCAVYHLAPLSVKLEALNSCLVSTILYGCECWGNCIPKEIEIAYRMPLKTALSIRNNTSNEIVYIESGMYPLECIIKKRQLSFWMKIENCDENRVLTYVLQKANQYNLDFVHYYKNLKEQFKTPEDCEKTLKAKYNELWRTKIEAKARDDADSKLGAYLDVNPNFRSIDSYHEDILELERIILTRFRTGSHNLKIEIGRHNKQERAQRLCKCNQQIQTLRHIIFECTLLDEIREIDFNELYTTTDEFFRSNEATVFLIKAMKILKVKI